MRVTLLHNEAAGSEDHTAEDLAESIQRAGHEVVGKASSMHELEISLRQTRPDLIGIAGGDGTVGRAACALSGFQLPFAILPLGTANNTARTLGISGSVEDLIAGWEKGSLRSFDLVRLTDAETSVLFSEAAGWGVFPEVIVEANRLTSPEDRTEALKRDRGLFRAAIEAARPRPYEIEVDGTRLSGEYLLVQVMNVPYIGPGLHLSPASNPNDGRLEVVLVGERDRDTLLRAVEGDDAEAGSRLLCHSASRVVVHHTDPSYQRDGHLVESNPERARNTLTLSVERSAVRYLIAP